MRDLDAQYGRWKQIAEMRAGASDKPGCVRRYLLQFAIAADSLLKSRHVRRSRISI